ncbi:MULTISPECIES: PAAR domain-containing protein [unclassified Pseudomonas]|uniref:PAAR domain-containing protein n=1 Tax=unclassified Pseudomonas TaxID=196821 RepID=UPI001CE202BF|nr:MULTISPECIES: PAAR domain-containing protein [unclassified Pseudomonas]
MSRPEIYGRGQALDGDKTTSGATLISTLTYSATSLSRGIVRMGDPTTTCPRCGREGVVAEGDPRNKWDGALCAVDGNIVSCGCPHGSNRIIAPLGPMSLSKVAEPIKAANQSSHSLTSSPNAPAKSNQTLTATEKPEATEKGPQTPELIAVAGSQHDNASGNKMMFIGQAVRELGEFKRSQPAMMRTLVLFTPAYNGTMLSAARSSAEAYGASVVTVTNAVELIDYLNSGKDRKQSPIKQLSLFSHGVPHRVAFGYHTTDDYQMSLDVLNYSKLSPQAFSPTARIDSYACRTGMGNRPDYPIEEAIQFFPQTNESLAQLLANHLRVKVRAYVRRSDYRNTWGTFEERRMGDLCGITDSSVPGQEWCKKWNLLRRERKDNNDEFDFTYQKTGALNPVISGDTPLGVPGGHLEFIAK